MMKLTEADIDNITRVARLKSSPEEKNRLLQNINTILSSLEIVDEIDNEAESSLTSPKARKISRHMGNGFRKTP